MAQLTAYGQALGRWLQRAMRDPVRGKRRTTVEKLSKIAKMSPDTVYRILRGEGDEVGLKKIRDLARALEVPAPIVERTLRAEGDPTKAQTALDWVVEAQDALDRTKALLRPHTGDAGDAERAR